MSISELGLLAKPEDVYNVSNKLTYADEDLVESFLVQRLRQYAEYGMYPYFLHPLFNESTGNFRSRFLVIDIDTDSVLVLFKYVFVMTTKYIRLFGNPISKLGIKENEKRVLDTLTKAQLVKQQITLDELDGTYADSDFFCDVQETWKHINRSKWRSSHDINKLCVLGTITHKLADVDDTKNIMQLFEFWSAGKSDLSYPKFTKYLVDHLGSMGILGTCLYLDSTLISYNLYYEQFDGTSLYAACQGNFGKAVLPETLDIPEQTLKLVIKSVGGLAYYKNIEYFSNTKVRYIYAAGESHVESLLENKSRFYPKRIKYFIKGLL